MCINGRWVSALMDSGCEYTILPAWLIHKDQLRPTTQRVMAANGSAIHLLGTARVTAAISREQYTVEVSSQIVLTSDDWYRMDGAHDALWMFKRGAIRLLGRTYKLSERKQHSIRVQRATLVRATTWCVWNSPEQNDKDDGDVTVCKARSVLATRRSRSSH